MFVTIVYPYEIKVGRERFEFQPWSQYDHVKTETGIGKNWAGDTQEIYYYYFDFDGDTLKIPETHAVLESIEREGKYAYPRFVYDKYTGEFNKPADWIKDYIERTGNDIRKNMRARHNGENLQIPKSREPESTDQSEQKDSGDQIYEI
ncbi:MAG: hypothetical protein K9M80_01885 [Candidatus Marinimicrobia bacterium]|nr:hypothetical protein [Candidatus Neomarinimicrobiota bacterium]